MTSQQFWSGLEDNLKGLEFIADGISDIDDSNKPLARFIKLKIQQIREACYGKGWPKLNVGGGK
jgi:hypothetical protein